MDVTREITCDGWTATLVEAGTIPLDGTDLAPTGVPDVVTVPSNVLLLRGHGQVILVDTSAGSLSESWPGAKDDLEGALAAYACRLEDVDMVVLTHLDFDHCGGVASGSYPDALVPAFSKARVVASADAIAWARTLEPPDDSAWRCLATVEAAGRLVEASYGRELAPGVTLVRTPGHRTGHAAVTVGDAVHFGDVIHHTSHVANPEWDHVHDSEPDAALRTRLAVLEEFVDAPACASHISGWGSVRRDGDGLSWVPL
jgi:glyoxylase-like metal-dependent hydrolase (beta-lactamase superfamily II)